MVDIMNEIRKGLSLLLLFVVSCSTEKVEGIYNEEGYETKDYRITLSGEVHVDNSRTHWEILDDDRNSLVFAWDNSVDEMKSFVFRDGLTVGFENGKAYSATKVVPDENVMNKAELEINESLVESYLDNDIVWAVSPVSDANIKNDGNSPYVEFKLPDEYVQDGIKTTAHLKPYILMCGNAAVKDNTANIKFSVLPAIYRFKVINNDNETLQVTEVGITGPFCDKAILNVTGTPQYSLSTDSYTIKVTTIDDGISIGTGDTSYLYALVFPTATKTIQDEITLYIKGRYGEVPADYSVTAPCNAVYPEFNLESNKYYDMRVPVSRQGIVLDGVDIDEFYPGGEFDITIDK